MALNQTLTQINLQCTYKVERHGAKARAIAGKRSEIVEQR